jgi:hypothetical protein
MAEEDKEEEEEEEVEVCELGENELRAAVGGGKPREVEGTAVGGASSKQGGWGAGLQ